jgi:hypothetical protein
MMVPRAFLYTSASPNTRTGEKDGRVVSSMRRKSATTGPIRGATAQEIAATLDIPYNTPSPPTASTPSALPAPTDPVVIPQSRRSSRGETAQNSARRRLSKTDTIVTVIRDGDLTDDNTESSPSPKPQARTVAELLAVTKITPPRRMRWRQRRDFRSESLAEDFNRLLVEDIKSRDDGVVTGSFGHGFLDILLSPPNEETTEEDEVLEAKGIRGSPSSARSISTESMPSLLTDDESTTSASVPFTPAVGRKSIQDRRARMLLTSEDCLSDHPLLPNIALDPPLRSISSPDSLLSHQLKSPPRRPPPIPHTSSSSFKSNLTASLRALKTAAQSVSNFTSSSTRQEDFITRSLFSPQMTDDRRPSPSEEPPSPALRRYLNPVPVPLVPTDLYMYNEHPVQPTPRSPQNQNSKSPPTSVPCTASIQLQTYRRSHRPSSSNASADTATAPPVFAAPISEATSTSALSSELYSVSGPPPRQREPRENSDFLRMVVCEMEMRRKGKFRDDVAGRARIWLPARKVEKGAEKGRGKGDGVDAGGGVPKRWVALLPGE